MARGYYARLKEADPADIIACLRAVPPLAMKPSQNSRFHSKPGDCILVQATAKRRKNVRSC